MTAPVQPEQPGQVCNSRGPRMGSEGVPRCRLALNHEGPHRPSPEDGWGSALTWSDFRPAASLTQAADSPTAGMKRVHIGGGRCAAGDACEELDHSVMPAATPVPDEAQQDGERLCDCYPQGFTFDTYEGPQPWCDVHGLPSAAWDQGVTEGIEQGKQWAALAARPSADTETLRARIEALTSDFDANGNGCQLGDQAGNAWHKAAGLLRAALDER